MAQDAISDGSIDVVPVDREARDTVVEFARSDPALDHAPDGEVAAAIETLDERADAVALDVETAEELLSAANWTIEEVANGRAYGPDPGTTSENRDRLAVARHQLFEELRRVRGSREEGHD